MIYNIGDEKPQLLNRGKGLYTSDNTTVEHGNYSRRLLLSDIFNLSLHFEKVTRIFPFCFLFFRGVMDYSDQTSVLANVCEFLMRPHSTIDILFISPMEAKF